MHTPEPSVCSLASTSRSLLPTQSSKDQQKYSIPTASAEKASRATSSSSPDQAPPPIWGRWCAVCMVHINCTSSFWSSNVHACRRHLAAIGCRQEPEVGDAQGDSHGARHREPG